MKDKLIFNILVVIGLLLAPFPAASAVPARDAAGQLSAPAEDLIWTRIATGPALSDAAGWSNIQYYPTIQTANINGDDREELLARDSSGIRAWRYVDESTGWVELKHGPAWSDAAGWANPIYNTTIMAADINGDGREELLGRDMLGMQVWRYVDETTGWVELHRGPPFSDAFGWGNLLYTSTIQTADIDGDHKAELLARDMLGIQAWHYVDETTGWTEMHRGPGWSDSLSWDQVQYYGTIQTGDIDGDGAAELLARDILGMQVWRYANETTGWTELHRGPSWSDASDWDLPQYYGTIQTGDINGDGRAELLARNIWVIEAWRYVDESTGWQSLTPGPMWPDTASIRPDGSVNTWANICQYASIQTGDTNGDGSAELLGLNTSSLETWHYTGATNLWTPLPVTPWSVWDNWCPWQYFDTIQTADINGDDRAELLGRSGEGIEVWGWDDDHPVTESLELLYVDEFDVKLVGSNVALYSPRVPEGYYSLGDYSQLVHGVTTGFSFAARELVPGALAAPLGYLWIWVSGYSIWRPVPPPGYICLGLVAQPDFTVPSLDRIRCVREDLTLPGRLGSYTGHDDVGIDVTLRTNRILPAFDHGIYFDSFTATYIYGPQILYALDSRAVKGVDPLTAQQVDSLIQEYGPVVYFHPDEKYFMDDPSYVLDRGVRLAWALVYNETSYSDFQATDGYYMPTNSQTLKEDQSYLLNEIKPNPPYSNSYYFRYWLDIPLELRYGDENQDRTKAFVRVLPWNTFFTEIQFWFFYPYNGPGRIRACIIPPDECFWVQLGEYGRHVGDWEHVSLKFENTSQKLVSIYMSQHDGGFEFSANHPGLLKDGNHPIVLSGIYSHANYPQVGTIYYLRIIEVDFGGLFIIDSYDVTGVGKSFQTYQPGNYEIISSDSFPVHEPGWLRYQSRWGQYMFNQVAVPLDFGVYQYTFIESEVSSGPSGPAMKGSWRTGDFADLFLVRDAPDVRYAWPKNPPLDTIWNFLYLPMTANSP